jgi:pectinesterase
MFRFTTILALGFLLSACAPSKVSESNVFLTVDLDGSGDFRSIQQAIDSVPDKPNIRAYIIVKNGIYREKLFIEKNFITLIGESMDGTVVEFAELRKNWLKENDSDWGAATINIRGSDFALLNMTVKNNYGDLHGDHDHQFAIRSFEKATRIITDMCKVVAAGADTLGLWNKHDGMYYHRHCHFEGYVDMFCPRGWSYITDSTFYNHKQSATLWHDGESDKSQKLVVRQSYFDGVPGFELGRRHYDAQFYLIDVRFSKHMADKPIYRKTYPDEPQRDRPNRWGDRYYFFNATYEGGELSWAANNLHDADGGLIPNDVTPVWTFNGKWNPESRLYEIYKVVEEHLYLSNKSPN